MNIRALVDRGIEIHAELARLKEELKGIEEKLKKAGLEGEHKELKDADREGRRWEARGSSRIVPVVFTADKLIGTFKDGSAVHKKISIAAQGKLDHFYWPTTTFENRFKDGKQFRSKADEILGNQFGPGFITACLARDKHGIPKSDVKIEWDSTEEIA